MLCLAQLGGGAGCCLFSRPRGERWGTWSTPHRADLLRWPARSLCSPRQGGDINTGHMSQPRREFRQAPRKNRGSPAKLGRQTGTSGCCQARSRLPGSGLSAPSRPPGTPRQRPARQPCPGRSLRPNDACTAPPAPALQDKTAGGA